MDNKLSKIYYSAKGYWKGIAAISKLSKAGGVDENDVRKWLEKQSLWQIYKNLPDYNPRPRWNTNKPNQIHQADLLFLPHDTVRGKSYKYALVVVDIASRYKEADALTSKESKQIGDAFKKIYSRTKQTWPDSLMVDPGREFMGNVTQLMKKYNVAIQRSEAGNHRAKHSLKERIEHWVNKYFLTNMHRK